VKRVNSIAENYAINGGIFYHQRQKNVFFARYTKLQMQKNFVICVC